MQVTFPSPLTITAMCDALAEVLIRAGLTTGEELGALALEAEAKRLEAIVAAAQGAARARSNVGH